jgi:agmatine deiminase
MKKPYLMPEWAHTKAVLLAWPYAGGDWSYILPQAQACYSQIVQAISQVVPVWLLVHPTENLAQVQECLAAAGCRNDTLLIQHHIPYNDTWIRDYGPLSRNSDYLQFEFNGWGGKYAAPLDNAVPGQLAHLLGGNPVAVPFVCEGGGLETNGEVLLLNQECIVDELRNPGVSIEQVAEILREHLGVQTLEWISQVQLTCDDTDGHIDTIARFVSKNHLVYSGPNPGHTDAEALAHLHAQLEVIAARHNWRLTALPSPQVFSQVDQRQLPATYANFLLCNDYLFLPVYGVAEDDAAVQVLRAACPQYQVVPIRCETLLEQHGSLHCATMQVISHEIEEGPL